MLLTLKEEIDFEMNAYMHRIEAQIKWFILLFSSSSLLLSYAMQFHSTRIGRWTFYILLSPLRLFSSCNHKKKFACFLFAALSLRHRMSYSYKMNSLEKEGTKDATVQNRKKNRKRAVCAGIKQSKHKFVF
jgi:hypothetical protein